MPALPAVSDGLRAVLDAVQNTGHSAHPDRGERISPLVFAVAVNRAINPVQLQAEVEAYADAMDAIAVCN